MDESLNFEFIFVDCLDYQDKRMQHPKAKFIVLSDDTNATENIKILSVEKSELLNHNMKIQCSLEGNLRDWLDFEENQISDHLSLILNNIKIGSDVIPCLFRKSSGYQLPVKVGQKPSSKSVSNYANLLQVSVDGSTQIVQWVLHFNSNFYQKRTIHPPPLNVRSLN